MTKDRVTGLIAVIIGLVVAFATMNLPDSMMQGDVGPKVFPFISAGLLIICGLGLIITSRTKEEKPFYTKAQLGRLALIFGVVFLYVVLMSVIGYLPATIIGAFVLSVMFGRKEKIAWWKSLIFAVILAVVLNYAFTVLFSIQLPQGMFF